MRALKGITILVAFLFLMLFAFGMLMQSWDLIRVIMSFAGEENMQAFQRPEEPKIDFNPLITFLILSSAVGLMEIYIRLQPIKAKK